MKTPWLMSKLKRGISSRKLLIVCAVLLVPGAVLAVGVAVNYFFFDSPTVYPTGEHPLDVALGDLDRDGNLDALTANRDGHSISVLLGTGDGSFTQLPPVTTELGPTSLALGDLDQDGQLDVVVSMCQEQCLENRIQILTGRGDGSFAQGKVIAVGGVPYNVTLTDFDGDGLLDIAASDYPGQRLMVLLNQGTGSFQEISLPTGQNTIAVLARDLNGDGFLDLISSNHGSGTSSVYLGRGNGEFSERIEVQTGELPYSIALADFDGDRYPDLTVAHSTTPGRVSILRNEGDGRFRLSADFSVEDAPVFVETADFNGDGMADIIVTRYQSMYASVYLNTGGGRFAKTRVDIPARNRIYSLAVADLNEDGLPDLVAVDYEQETLSVAMGRPLVQ